MKKEAAQNSAADLETSSLTRVLFLDMLEIEGTQNAELIVNPAEKNPVNPVLQLGDVGSFDCKRASSWAGTVLFDEDEELFKMWYFAQTSTYGESMIGYAVSGDGVIWEKPELGLYEYGGNRSNNIVYRSSVGRTVLNSLQKNMTGHFTITKDSGEPDEAKRYKGWVNQYYEQEKRNAFFTVYSSDGIHWDTGDAPVDYPDGDATNLIVDHADPDPEKRIKMYGNGHRAVPGLGHRDMGFGPDIENCVRSPFNPVIEPEEGKEHTVHLFVGIHYYGYYLALYNYNLWLDYHGQKGDIERRKADLRVPEPKTGAFVGDTRLAVNRDGIGKFKRVNWHQPVITRGEKGEWDSGFIVTADPIVRNDTIYLFYTALDEAGGASPNTHLTNVPTTVRTGLASWKLDRFTHLQSQDGMTPAHAVTVPIRVANPARADPAGAELILNASRLIPYRDWIEVEVLDGASDDVIPGYDRRACTDLSRDGLRLPVRWGDRRTLKDVKAKEIKLRFVLYGRARLHSFTFAP